MNSNAIIYNCNYVKLYIKVLVVQQIKSTKFNYLSFLLRVKRVGVHEFSNII